MTHDNTMTKTAASADHPLLDQARRKFGFVPNLLTTMAAAPKLLESYMSVGALFDQTSLNPTERQVVLLATSFENSCAYCMAAHSTIAKMQGVDDGVIEALRSGVPIANAKLEALRQFASEVTTRRGWPEAATRDAFRAAGYSDAQALEVVLGVGMKTLSNYANHMMGTTLDTPFEPAAWSDPR